MGAVCQVCGAPFTAADLDPLRSLGSCRFCKAVTPIPTGHQRAPAPLPARFTALELPDSLRVEWRWFKPGVIMLVFFCIAWDSSLFMFYSNAWSSGSGFALLFPIGHVAAGVLVTHQALTGLFNRTLVELEHGVLTVRHGPIPAFKRGFVLAGASLAQLYVKARGGSSESPATYDLCALTDDGLERIILPGLEEADQALYLEQQIEARLKIADRPIAGEIPRQ